ncbi:MAG: hypothetical protein ABSF03_28785 [Streptosporangiaceae bacterium]
MNRRIQPGPRCGGPDVCGNHQAHAAREPGGIRPWGQHDVQCQVPGGDARQYPECSYADEHRGDHDYQWRQGTPGRAAYEAQFRPPGGWPPEESAPPQEHPEGSPYEWFWANVVRKPCPDCSHPTGVGFDRNDPGVLDRKPARCTECSASAIHRDIQIEAAHPGIRLAGPPSLQPSHTGQGDQVADAPRQQTGEAQNREAGH